MSNRSEQALNAIEPLVADLSYGDKSVVIGLIFETLDGSERRRELERLLDEDMPQRTRRPSYEFHAGAQCRPFWTVEV